MKRFVYVWLLVVAMFAVPLLYGGEIETNLQELKSLKEKGLITEQEYQTSRKKLLEEFFKSSGSVGSPVSPSSGGETSSTAKPEPGKPWKLPDLGMEFVWIPPGELRTAGDSANGESTFKLRITKGFWLGKYEVTYGQYRQVMEKNPGHGAADDLPVEVDSFKASQFCDKLNKKTGLAVRLPTEAEWEYACRAGTTTRYYNGNTEDDLKRAGWYKENSGGRPHPVGQKEPNAWGLYDMLGNVWELVFDPLPGLNVENRRGGAWDCGSSWCDAASSRRNMDFAGNPGIPPPSGFRVAIDIPSNEQKGVHGEALSAVPSGSTANKNPTEVKCRLTLLAHQDIPVLTLGFGKGHWVGGWDGDHICRHELWAAGETRDYYVPTNTTVFIEFGTWEKYDGVFLTNRFEQTALDVRINDLVVADKTDHQTDGQFWLMEIDVSRYVKYSK